MLQRNLEGAIRSALADSPIVLLVGARQTGKSTLIQSPEFKQGGRRYLTFDDTNVLAAAKTDPVGFLNSFNEPLTLDEVQRVPELFLPLKASVDRDRRPGRYLLSGSANVLFLPKVADSLAGRMEVLTLWPFSQGELEGIQEGFVDALFDQTLLKIKSLERWEEKREIQQRVVRGGFPEAISRPTTARRNAWSASYLTTILQRDVRDLSRIEDVTALPRLLSILAGRTAGLLNSADVSRSSGITQTSVKRYLSLLETVFLVLELPGWSGNIGKRFMKMPKLLFSDSGLAAHLLAMPEERAVQDPGTFGHLLENFVAMELVKQLTWSKARPRLYHWRTHGQQEVDLVLEWGGRLSGIEVKSSSSVSADDFRGLKTLAGELKQEFVRGIVLYLGDQVLPFGPNLWALPVSALWRL